MPLISNQIKKNEPSKHFQKKTYRPWDEDSLITDNSKVSDKVIHNTTISNINHYNVNDDSNLSTQVKDLEEKQQLVIFDYKKELRNLFGAQKLILQYLLNQIEEEHDGYIITKPIYMSELIESCKLSINTIKGTLQTLKARKFFETHENKQGRGGYARYKFNKEVFTFFSNNLIP